MKRIVLGTGHPYLVAQALVSAKGIEVSMKGPYTVGLFNKRGSKMKLNPDELGSRARLVLEILE